MVYISQSVCVIFDFFQQCLIVFCIQVFCLFGWFIPRYFILFVAVVNTIVSLTSLSDFSLLVYRNADVWYIKCCPCYKTFAYFFICCCCLVTMMFNSLQLHARLSYPSPTPGACSSSWPSSWQCHPTISSSAALFSFCLQSFPTSGSVLMSCSWHQMTRVLELQHQSFQ